MDAAASGKKSSKSQRLVQYTVGAMVGAIGGVIAAKRVARGGPNILAFHLMWANNWPIITSAALWLAFSVYWGIEARNAAKTKNAEPQVSTIFHQVFLNIALLLLFLPVPGLEQRFLPQSAFVAVIGLVVQSAFVLLAVWARRHLGRNWSAEVRLAVDHQLIRTGPYRHLRHPIYTAMLGMFLGTAIASGQVHALLGLLLLPLLYWRKTRLEEGILLKAFGTEYEAYRRETWAFVPLVY